MKASHKLTSWSAGRGFVVHGQPLPKGAQRTVCAPAKAPDNDSLHFLLPPGGGPHLAFRWIADEKAWTHWNRGHMMRRARRMAFSPEYLGSHGWRYERAVRPNETGNLKP